MEKIKNYIIPICVGIIGVLLYLNINLNSKVNQKDNLIKASSDTLHTFKTTIGNQGAYISTLVGNKEDLITILNSRVKQDSINKDIIDSLKRDKRIESITGIKTSTKIEYKHKLDTVQSKVNLQDTIKTKWWDAYLNIKNDSLGLKVNTRDELLLPNKLKPNKGLFSGSTLTSYVVSKNPNTDITGVVSISTKVDQPKLMIRPAIGFGLNSDVNGKNVRVGFNAGAVITF